MSSRIYLVPFKRTNPDAKPDGSWRVMLEDDKGKRHINHADNLETAIEKAKRAADKRGLQFDRPGLKTPQAVAPEQSTEPAKPKKDYMDVSRPKGAPKIGTRIYELLDGGDKRGPLTVTDYLASQFVAEDEAGNVRIIIASSVNWEKA